MAILRNVTTDNGSKSLGMVTLRNSRGRTIASQKRTLGSGKKTSAQSQYQFLFSLVSHFMRLISIDIRESFDKSKYGSERNAFFKLNKTHLYAAFSTLAANAVKAQEIAIADGNSPEVNMITVPFATFNAAIIAYVTTNPNTIIRAYKKGYTVEYVSTSGWVSYIPPSPSTAIADVDLNGTDVAEHSGVLTVLEGEVLTLNGTSLSGEILTVTAATSVVGQFVAHPLTDIGTVTNVSAIQVKVQVTATKFIIKDVRNTADTLLFDFTSE
jgi:hypothetical protein